MFCRELAAQEMDSETRYFDIPDEVMDIYRIYRPAPLCRAYNLEKALDTPAKIYYKFEGNNTSGSHKLNSAVAQAYYAKKEGLKGVTTETGAGQWGTALSEACSYFGLDLEVYMVKVSYQQKPFRKDIMQTFGANVFASPSDRTEAEERFWLKIRTTAEALAALFRRRSRRAVTSDGYKYVLGSVLNQVVLHQSVIGLESKLAMEMLDEYPDIVIGCAGGGSNLGGLIAPFMQDKLTGKADPRIIAVEPSSCPSFTRGRIQIRFLRYGQDHTDGQRCTPWDARSNRRRTTRADSDITGCRRSCLSCITTDIWKPFPASRRRCSRRLCSSPSWRPYCRLLNRHTPSGEPSMKPSGAGKQAKRRPYCSV